VVAQIPEDELERVCPPMLDWHQNTSGLHVQSG
jgi:hypothetical protein